MLSLSYIQPFKRLPVVAICQIQGEKGVKRRNEVASMTTTTTVWFGTGRQRQQQRHDNMAFY